MTFKFLLSNEILLLLFPLAFFLLVATVRAVTRIDLSMSKVWLTIKVALFGILLASVVRPFRVPVEYTPYIMEIHGLILLFCWANLVAYLFVDTYLHRRMKGNVPTFLRDILLLGVYLFFGATALRVIFDINMASILTGTTVLTAALAFAMQTTLANIISSFQIQADEAFRRGTWIWIKEKDITGEIVNVGFRYSTVRTLEGHLVHVPSLYMTQNVVHSIGSRPGATAPVTLKVLLDYAFPPERAKAILLDVLRDEPQILSVPAPWVKVDGFMDSGIEYSLRFYLEEYITLLEARDKVLRRVWYAVTREGQTFPYPHREIVRKEPARPFRMDAAAIHGSLRRVEILSPLGEEELDALVPYVRLRVYGKGETVVRQGEEGDSLFINLCGNLEVSVDGQTVGSLSRGDFFGEMSLLTGEKRRATVAALDEVQLVEISKDAIAPIIRSHPSVLGGLSSALGERLQKILSAQQVRKVVDEATSLDDALLYKLRRFFGIS
ncbi:MAG: mechanosensitive ion channel [Deltaproteobacteria bacterium]|nr:mechanosensitive ion channel [Deltaproteobacteria bacterium]